MAENINNIVNVFGDVTKELVHNTLTQINEKLINTLSLKEVTSLDLNLIDEPGFYFISTNNKHKNLPGYDINGGEWSKAFGGVLLVISDPNFDTISSHNYRFIQIFFKITTNDAIATSAFIRRKATYTLPENAQIPKDNEEDIDWTSWRSFPDQSKFFSEQGVITSKPVNNIAELAEADEAAEIGNAAEVTDLDTISIPGIYYLSTTYEYVNAPALNDNTQPHKQTGGLLLVYNDLNANDTPTVKTDTRLYQMFICGGNTIYTRWKQNASIGFTPWVSFATTEQVQNKVDKYHGLEKYDILEYNDGNLFDGKWITGKRIAGSGPKENNTPFTLVTDNNACFLGIVACKPNTTYTIIHANPIKELYWADNVSEYCYFKVTSASRLLADNEKFNLKVNVHKANITSNQKLFVEVTTGPADRYLYIQGGYKRENFGDNFGPYIKVVEGECDKLDGEYDGSSYGADKATFRLANDLAPKLETNIIDTTIVTGGAAKQNLFNGFFCEGLWLNSNAKYEGKLIEGTEKRKLTGSLGLQYKEGYNGTLIVGVKPNTIYSIIKEPTGLEQFGASFFSVLKVAQTETDLANLFDKYSTPVDIAGLQAEIKNVSIYEGNEGTGYAPDNADYYPCQFSATDSKQTCTTHFTTKTGPDTKYLIVSVGKELQPLVQIVEGVQTELTVDSYEELNGLNYSTGRANSARRARGQLNFYKWYDKDPNSDSYNCPYMVVTNGRNTYTFLYDDKKTSNGKTIKTWRWYNHKIDGRVRYAVTDSECENNQYTENCTCLWDGTDSEGAIKIEGQSDFIGGYHKGEKITGITVLIDGKKIEAGSIEALNSKVFIKHGCKNVTFIIDSQLNLHESVGSISKTDTIFNRTKKIEITHTKVKVSNTWTATEAAAGLRVERSVLAGLYSVRKNFLNGYSDNVTKKFYPAKRKTKDMKDYAANGLNGSPLRDEVTFYGNRDFVLTVRSLTDKYQYESQWDTASNEKVVPNYRGSVSDFDKGNNHQDRYKVYFDDKYQLANPLEITKNTILSGCFEIETLTDDLNFIENV